MRRVVDLFYPGNPFIEAPVGLKEDYGLFGFQIPG